MELEALLYWNWHLENSKLGIAQVHGSTESTSVHIQQSELKNNFFILQFITFEQNGSNLGLLHSHTYISKANTMSNYKISYAEARQKNRRISR